MTESRHTSQPGRRRARAELVPIGTGPIGSKGANYPEVDRSAQVLAIVAKVLKAELGEAYAEVVLRLIAQGRAEQVAAERLVSQAQDLARAGEGYLNLVMRQWRDQERLESDLEPGEDEGIDLAEVMKWRFDQDGYLLSAEEEKANE